MSVHGRKAAGLQFLSFAQIPQIVRCCWACILNSSIAKSNNFREKYVQSASITTLPSLFCIGQMIYVDGQ